MARSRRPPASSSGSSSAYQRRNERARSLGYRNYYDYRIHNHGRTPPDAAAPTGADRARLRGHRGTEDLLRTLKPGAVIVVPEGLQSIPKDAKGRYSKIEVLVLREDGRSERFTIRRASYDRVVKILERMAAAGAMFSPAPSLDLRRLARVADRPDVDDEDEDE